MRIKFLSLNVWEGGRLFEPMVEFLRQENADICAFQEVLAKGGDAGGGPPREKRFRCFEALSEELGYPHATFAPAFRDEDSGAESGNAVLSRFPIHTLPTVFFDVPYGSVNLRTIVYPGNRHLIPFSPRNLQRVLVELPNGKNICVFNTQGIWGTDPWDNPRRLAMGEAIAREVEGKSPAILCGDFNVGAETETIGKIENRLVNIFKDNIKTSFNTKRMKPFIKNPSLIDMVFTSPDLKVLSASCPIVDISDHLPQIVELET